MYEMKFTTKLRLIWTLSTSFSIFITYPFLEAFLTTNNYADLGISLMISIFLIIAIQELLASFYIKIFPFWILIFISGIILGFIFFSIYVTIFLSFLVVVANISLNSVGILGSKGSKVLTIILIPSATAFFYVFTTHIFWNGFISSISNSNRLSEKTKLFFIGILFIMIGVFFSLIAYFLLIIVFFNNSMISYFIATIIFAYATYAGFTEVCSENNIIKVFEVKKAKNYLI